MIDIKELVIGEVLAHAAAKGRLYHRGGFLCTDTVFFHQQSEDVGPCLRACTVPHVHGIIQPEIALMLFSPLVGFAEGVEFQLLHTVAVLVPGLQGHAAVSIVYDICSCL